MTRPDQLLDLVADLCHLATRRAPGARSLPYLAPAAAALDLAVRRGATGPRVAGLRAWLLDLSQDRRGVAA